MLHIERCMKCEGEEWDPEVMIVMGWHFKKMDETRYPYTQD
jgi:hypothetical protein